MHGEGGEKSRQQRHEETAIVTHRKIREMRRRKGDCISAPDDCLCCIDCHIFFSLSGSSSWLSFYRKGKRFRGGKALSSISDSQDVNLVLPILYLVLYKDMLFNVQIK